MSKESTLYEYAKREGMIKKKIHIRENANKALKWNRKEQKDVTYSVAM